MSDTREELRQAEYEDTYRDMYGCYPDDDEDNEETLTAKQEHIREILGWRRWI